MAVLAVLPDRLVLHPAVAPVFIIVAAHLLDCELVAAAAFLHPAVGLDPQALGLVIVAAVAAVPVFAIVGIQPVAQLPVMEEIVAGMAAQADQHPGHLPLGGVVIRQILQGRVEGAAEAVAEFSRRCSRGWW